MDHLFFLMNDSQLSEKIHHLVSLNFLNSRLLIISCTFIKKR